MSRNRNQNALLVEIMIAVLFFALCSTIILETFVGAREYSRRAGVHNEAIVDLQSLAERLNAADDVHQLLEKDGFLLEEDTWMLEGRDYTVEVELAAEQYAAGTLNTAQLRAICRDEIIAQLPWAHYIPGEASA